MSSGFTVKSMGVSLSIDQKSLLSYAESHSVKDYSSVSSPKNHQIPELLPRPVDEGIPKAIKRLSLSNTMFQDAELLHRCSALMSRHIVKVRAVPNIIDGLELLFRNLNKNYKNDSK